MADVSWLSVLISFVGAIAYCVLFATETLNVLCGPCPRIPHSTCSPIFLFGL